MIPIHRAPYRGCPIRAYLQRDAHFLRSGRSAGAGRGRQAHIQIIDYNGMIKGTQETPN